MAVPGHPGIFALNADAAERYRQTTSGWRRADRADGAMWPRVLLSVAAGYGTGLAAAIPILLAIRAAFTGSVAVDLPLMMVTPMLGYMFAAPLGPTLVGSFLEGMGNYPQALMGSFWSSFFFQTGAIAGFQIGTGGPQSLVSFDATLIALVAMNWISAVGSTIGYEIAGGAAAGQARIHGIALAPVTGGVASNGGWTGGTAQIYGSF